MGYAIICNARKGGNLGVKILGLVDRAKTKRVWWTSDTPALLMRFDKLSAAQFSAKRLARNNARVVTADAALKMLRQQEHSIDWCATLRAADAAAGEGWDSHKTF